MRSTAPNRHSLIVGPMLLFGAILVLAQAPAPGTHDARLVSEFKEKTQQYLNWRENVAGKAPAPTDSPGKLDAARRELADKIRTERAATKQGELFTPEIAQYFRRNISQTMSGKYG